MVGHFDDQRRRAGVRQLRKTSLRSPRSAPAAPTTSCAPRSARWSSTSTRPARSRRDARRPAAAVEAYRDDYAAYYERCKHPDSPAMRDPNAVSILSPASA